MNSTHIFLIRYKDNMKYQVKATQTLTKYITIEADSEDNALEKAQIMAEEGEIHFDDDTFLDLEMNVTIV